MRASVPGHHQVVEERTGADQPGAAVDAQRLTPSGNHEEKPDVGIGQDVDEPVRPPVARTLTDHDRPLVDHDERPRRVALG
jgi:hypothetical protein